MAGFFEKFGEKVANVVGGASDAVGDFAQESKLKMDIKKCEDTIKNLKAKFGIEAVEAKMAGEPEADILGKLETVCNEIRAVQVEIEGLKAEILKIKENKLNPETKSVNGEGSAPQSTGDENKEA